MSKSEFLRCYQVIKSILEKQEDSVNKVLEGVLEDHNSFASACLRLLWFSISNVIQVRGFSIYEDILSDQEARPNSGSPYSVKSCEKKTVSGSLRAEHIQDAFFNITQTMTRGEFLFTDENILNIEEVFNQQINRVFALTSRETHDKVPRIQKDHHPASVMVLLESVV